MQLEKIKKYNMYCLDTNIIIFILKNTNKTLTNKFFREFDECDFFTTSITVAELLYYSYKNKATKSLEDRKEFLKILTILNFDEKSADLFASNKSKLEAFGNKIDDLDLQIGSICLANNLILVTNNTKHFQNIEGLTIQDWTKP
jgi:tRNA(fMet)-specific endonuclease VapC